MQMIWLQSLKSLISRSATPHQKDLSAQRGEREEASVYASKWVNARVNFNRIEF
jgi:hypothetical protein